MSFPVYICRINSDRIMDQKERIIEQAMQMFVAQGIRSVRMDDIAQQLGVSKRALYELFGDKEGLLYLAMERFFECKRIERAAACAGARNVLEAMSSGGAWPTSRRRYSGCWATCVSSIRPFTPG